MKRIIAILGLVSFPALAWSPAKAVASVFGGKYGWAISVGAFGAAEVCDYRTTVTAINSGFGRETNPLLTNAQGQLIPSRMAAFKVLTFADPIGSESFLYWKMNEPQRKKYGKWMIVGNWVATGLVGGVAYHNRQIYERVR